MLELNLYDCSRRRAIAFFTTERARELSPRVGLKGSYLLEALHHLRRTGWIVSLRRGLYAISSSVPGTAPTHEFEIAMALVDPAAISHWSAMHYHELTEQSPRNVYVLTTTKTSVPRLRGAKAEKADRGYPVGGVIYQFIQVKPERFFGTEKVWVGEARVTIMLTGRVCTRYPPWPASHFGSRGMV
jgi:predicted transcriptional regulator of viral defense system